MGLVYALPYSPPATEAPSWGSMLMTWTGWDGTEWVVSDRSAGAVLLAGVRGMNVPPTTRYTGISPAVPGSSFKGISTGEREVFWPIKIFHGDGSKEWVLRDRAFWKTLDPERPGVWTVMDPFGAKRSLTMRFDNDGGQAFDILPSLVGWAHYGLTFVAEQPYWVGEPSVQSWKPPVSSPFFNTDGPALVNIDSGYTVDTAAMDNPGDVDSYPTWFLDGEISSASVGVGSLIVDVPFSIAAGKCVVINSDPKDLGCTMYDISAAEMAKEPKYRKRPSDRIIGVDLLNPVDRSADLGPADFGAIPPGQNVPLSITLNGTGIIEAYLPSLYRRSW